MQSLAEMVFEKDLRRREREALEQGVTSEMIETATRVIEETAGDLEVKVSAALNHLRFTCNIPVKQAILAIIVARERLRLPLL